MPSKKVRKKKLKKNFPCKCGHPKAMHGYAGESIGDEWCDGFVIRGDKGFRLRDICECERFVPDNLKYLEQRAKQKGKG